MRLRYALAVLVCCLLLAGCARQPAAQDLEFVLTEEGVYTFSDGMSVDLWQLDSRDDKRNYRLSDGTALLWERRSPGPENVITGQTSIQDLNETAQAAIAAYYEERGLLYDVEWELERAYRLYLRCRESGETYRDGMVEQTVVPVGKSQQAAYLQTILTLPLDEPGQIGMTNLWDVFERETGERLSMWDLFTVPEEEARRQLLREMRPVDIGDSPEARTAIAAALRPEYVSIASDRIEVWFPKGTLPEEEHDGWVLYYEDHPVLLDILQPWAIPDGPEAK